MKGRESQKTRSHQEHSAPVSVPAQGIQTRTWGFGPGEEGGLPVGTRIKRKAEQARGGRGGREGEGKRQREEAKRRGGGRPGFFSKHIGSCAQGPQKRFHFFSN